MNKIRNLVGPAGKVTEARGKRGQGGKPVKDELVFADEPRGFGVRILAAARAGSFTDKTYVIQYVHNRQKRRMSIGSCASIGLADAVKEARSLLGDAARGLDPYNARKEKARDEYPLATLIDEWKELYLKPRRRAHYAREAPAALRRIFKKYLSTGAAKLDPAALVRVHDALAKEHPAMASRAISYGSAAYSWAIGRHVLKDNPFANIRVTPARSRERVLTDEELRILWAATEGPGAYDSVVRLLILTGQRRQEIAAMTWGELSSDLSVLTLPSTRTKNHAVHRVPLSRQAREVIGTRPDSVDAKQLVFPGRDGDNVLNGWGTCKKRLDKKCGFTDWTLHDLRRTVATNLQKLGVRLEVTEAVLNHVSGSRKGIIGVYQKYTWDVEKVDALQRWGDRVEAIVSGRVTGNIVKLHA
jgi:integrase